MLGPGWSQVEGPGDPGEKRSTAGPWDLGQEKQSAPHTTGRRKIFPTAGGVPTATV
jgi:hypothetical protein